jgi:LmbE family N-acetylglucosaminyl deacetylase
VAEPVTIPADDPLGTAGVERVLVVVAHPDDVDFGASGTVAAWVAAGLEVTYAIVTNGDAGGFDRDVPRADIPSIRQAEQRAAAAAVGVTDVRFLGYVDGELTVSHELRRDVSRVIRQVRPQRVVCQSPERNWERLPASHPDHLAAGEASLQAVYPDARNPFAHPSLLHDEGLEPWVVPQVWVIGAPRINRAVDITGTWPDKIAALTAHVSQTAHMGDLDAFLRPRAEAAAGLAGLPAGRVAETFWTSTVPG